MEKDRTKSRYHIKLKIGVGDFATVYSADDKKLGREVAIKQLHPQYLDDKEKMARYWQEAQLLVSLEHPNIITIFDIVKARGRLILELMQGSLKQIYGGKPMPVQEVRQTIIQAAKGLQCLHENGIVHGDIKPGNLLLSRQDVVKLGDFGLARRVSDDDGSLLKGTTRYMAPELVSEEFGVVGPASDLYSLGFSSLEMLVGPDFDSLFPDLIAFGRDPQMAWMMWHCSADRVLPPVSKMLDGVPTDLAKVLEKLTAKKQSERYQSAQQVLDDLSGESAPVGVSLREQAAAAELAAKKHKKKRRIQALVACSLSLTACLAILFWPEPKMPEERVTPPSIYGVVQNVVPNEQKFVLDIEGDWEEFAILANDVIMLNRKERQLRDLELGDRVVIHTRLDPEEKSHKDIVAFRPETHVGIISQLTNDEQTFVLKVTEPGDDLNAEFVLKLPIETILTLNEKSKIDGRSIKAEDLAVGDRVVVRHSDDESGMLALSVDALRVVQMEGVIRKINLRKWLITVADGTGPDSKLVTLTVADDCQYELNGMASISEKLLKLKDLIPGDKVTLEHDVRVVLVRAYRVLEDQGRISSIAYDDRSIMVSSESGGRAAEYKVDSKCMITLGDEVIDFADLRVNDTVHVTHDSPEAMVPGVDILRAVRPNDSRKWAILIANQTFQDKQLLPLSRPIENARLLKDRLTARYAIPISQIVICEDFDRTRIVQEIPRILERIPANAELTVYLSTRAFNVANDNVYLASENFVLDELQETGIQLEWLIDQMENCRADQKLLLLDCSHPGPQNDPAQTSTTKMIELVQSTHRGGYPRSVFVMASCQEGQSATELPTRPNVGTFASILSDGFAGGADLQNDNQIKPTELFDYVQKTMASVLGSVGSSQSPKLFSPNPTPPRISDVAKSDIIGLLDLISEKSIDEDVVALEVKRVASMTIGQPDATLAWAILLIKFRKMELAQAELESLLREHPDCLLAHKAVVWLNFNKKRYDIGLARLASMMKQIPTPDGVKEDYDASALKDFEWAGRLREIAAKGFWAKRKPTASDIENFDRIMAQYGEEPNRQFEMGREHVQKVLADFANKIAERPDDQFELKRTRLRNYMNSIANEDAILTIRSGLDK